MILVHLVRERTLLSALIGWQIEFVLLEMWGEERRCRLRVRLRCIVRGRLRVRLRGRVRCRLRSIVYLIFFIQ